MPDEQTTKSLYASVEGNSPVANWTRKIVTVEEQIILDTDEGKVLIRVTEDGEMKVGPLQELRG